jgi:hypothetical protein
MDAPIRPVTSILKLVNFAKKNSLITINKKKYIITNKGKIFCNFNTKDNDLSKEHKKFIIENIFMQNVELKKELIEFFSNFIYIIKITEKKKQFETYYYKREYQKDINVAQQIVLFNYLDIISKCDEDKFALTEYGIYVFNITKASSRGISAEQLAEINRRNTEAGTDAEKFIVEYEMKRLVLEKSRPDLAKLVERVGHLDLTLGYDIKSFNGDSRD